MVPARKFVKSLVRVGLLTRVIVVVVSVITNEADVNGDKQGKDEGLNQADQYFQ